MPTAVTKRRSSKCTLIFPVGAPLNLCRGVWRCREAALLGSPQGNCHLCVCGCSLFCPEAGVTLKTCVNDGGDGKLGSLSLIRLQRDSRDRSFPSMLTPNAKLTATFLFNDAEWEQLTFNTLGVRFGRQKWLLDGERSRRLSSVCFRSDLFHKWFSPSCAELGAQTLSASSSIKQKIVAESLMAF